MGFARFARPTPCRSALQLWLNLLPFCSAAPIGCSHLTSAQWIVLSLFASHSPSNRPVQCSSVLYLPSPVEFPLQIDRDSVIYRTSSSRTSLHLNISLSSRNPSLFIAQPSQSPFLSRGIHLFESAESISPSSKLHLPCTTIYTMSANQVQEGDKGMRICSFSPERTQLASHSSISQISPL